MGLAILSGFLTGSVVFLDHQIFDHFPMDSIRKSF